MNAEERTLLIAEIPHLRRYALALVRDRDLADDLVQSSLERALSRFRLWRRNQRLRPWLFAIMHNLHVDLVRHRTAQGASVPLADLAQPPAQAADQDTVVAVRAVLAEIDNLDQDQRDVLVLVALDELSYEDAAAVLSIKVGTLMSRLHRGRMKLRERLGMKEPAPAIRRIK